MDNVLIENIDKLHTTRMSAMRIIKNLGLPEIDAVARCRSKLLGGHREAGQKLVCPCRRLRDHGECKQLYDDYGTSSESMGDDCV